MNNINNFQLTKTIKFEKDSEFYLNKNNFNQLFELFLDYLENENIELYNEDNLKFELGLFLKIILPKNYHIDFERNIYNFNFDGKYIKHEIDITIYPTDAIDEYGIIDSKKAYAIELKYPSYKIKDKKTGEKQPVLGYNHILKEVEKDIEFVKELVSNNNRNSFKEAWSIVVASKIVDYIYQQPKKFYKIKNNNNIYNKFREFKNNGEFKDDFPKLENK